MIQKSILLFILFLSGMLLLGNAYSPDFKMNQEIDIEKVLKNAKFQKGIIYQKNDSIESDILIFKGKSRKYSYQYCVVKNPNDSIVIYSPKEIDGYKVSNEKYVKHFSDGESFFILLKISGKVDLYFRDAIPYDLRFLYYLKLPNQKELLVLSPKDIGASIVDSKDSRAEPMMIYKTSQAEDKFKQFVEFYFSDCQEVILMVKSGFLTLNDIPGVVQEYNNCGKK